MLWMPMHRQGQDTNYAVDVLDVADILVKARVQGLLRDFDPRVGLIVSWLP